MLWVNYAVEYGKPGTYLTATSASPEGPFQIAHTDIKMDSFGGNHGDFHYFVDDDADSTAYMVYTIYGGPGGPNHKGGTTMTVQRLSADFTAPWTNHTASGAGNSTNSSGSSTPFVTDTSLGAPNFAESPSIFKWAGYYFVTSTHVCCFCRTGGGVSVFTAAHPLGPWSSRAYDIGCKGHNASDSSGKQTFNPESCPSSVGFMTNNSAFPTLGWSGAQQNGVHRVNTTSGPQLIWTGDRWYSALDGLKGHDFQFWAPLKWAPPDASSEFPEAPVLLPIGNPATFSLELLAILHG